MKKVLIIAGSPRAGGNSELLCDEFLKGAVESGNIAEKVTLRSKKIGYCIACDYCKNHSGECAFKDDTQGIIQKMIDADVIVLASPVYFYSIDAQMKALIDRCVARYLEIEDKETYYILTAAENSRATFDGSLACFRGFSDCLNGAKEKGIICGGGAWQVGEIKNTRAMLEAYNMGKRV